MRDCAAAPERVHDLYAAALERNRDEFEAMVRRLHRGASRASAQKRPISLNPSGQWLCGRSAALQILAIARLLLRYCARGRPSIPSRKVTVAEREIVNTF